MSSIKLSAAETKLLSLAWQCFETTPKVNVKTLALIGNYKTPASANSCWYTLKNKFIVKNGKTPATLNLTSADHKLLDLVWQCFESVPKVDVKKLAELGGYKTPASANSCWYALKKKLFPADGSLGSTTASPKSSPKKRAHRGVGGEGLPTPKKRCAGTTKITESEEMDVKVEGGVEEESDDELEVVQPKRNILASPRTLQDAESEQGGSATIKAEGKEGGSAISAEPKQCRTATESDVKQEVKVNVEDEEVPTGFFEQMLQYTDKA
ncbi:hypothetical protein LTR08_005697 [Meristemomyces frigidus]|nr:hypothetical protein LTR08_005697 [Meristemomyces frigidus]